MISPADLALLANHPEPTVIAWIGDRLYTSADLAEEMRELRLAAQAVVKTPGCGDGDCCAPERAHQNAMKVLRSLLP